MDAVNIVHCPVVRKVVKVNQRLIGEILIALTVSVKAGFHFGEFGSRRATKGWAIRACAAAKSKLKASVYWRTQRSVLEVRIKFNFFRDARMSESQSDCFFLMLEHATRTGSRDRIH